MLEGKKKVKEIVDHLSLFMTKWWERSSKNKHPRDRRMNAPVLFTHVMEEILRKYTAYLQKRKKKNL